MWYVNKTGDVVKIVSINSFILTMWYVNSCEKYKDEQENASFILTMWYVNTFLNTYL